MRFPLLAVCLAVLWPSAAAAAEYFPPPDSRGGWRTLTEPVAIRRDGVA